MHVQVFASELEGWGVNTLRSPSFVERVENIFHSFALLVISDLDKMLYCIWFANFQGSTLIVPLEWNTDPDPRS